jgi:hypothetical protein
MVGLSWIVASLRGNDETGKSTAPLFRTGRCGDARLVNWKELDVVFPSFLLLLAFYFILKYIINDHRIDARYLTFRPHVWMALIAARLLN